MTTETHIILGDAFDVLPTLAPVPHVFTGLPDAAEMDLPIAEWEVFYRRAVTLIVSCLAPDGYAIFYATDRRHDGVLASKASIIIGAADAAGARCVWHKVAIRTMGTSLFRPGYSHLIAVSKTGRAGSATPDVFDAGRKQYRDATDSTALGVGIAFLRAHDATSFVDPFCGRGSHGRAAKICGLDSVNIDVDPAQIAAARSHIEGAP